MLNPKAYKSETFCHATVSPKRLLPKTDPIHFKLTCRAFSECTMQLSSLSPTFKSPLAAHHSLPYSCVLKWPADIKKSDQWDKNWVKYNRNHKKLWKCLIAIYSLLMKNKSFAKHNEHAVGGDDCQSVLRLKPDASDCKRSHCPCPLSKLFCQNLLNHHLVRKRDPIICIQKDERLPDVPRPAQPPKGRLAGGEWEDRGCGWCCWGWLGGTGRHCVACAP